MVYTELEVGDVVNVIGFAMADFIINDIHEDGKCSLITLDAEGDILITYGVNIKCLVKA